MSDLPAWARQMRELFRSGSTSQFILYGNVHDVIPADAEGGTRYLALRPYLTEIMFAPFDVVIHYDRGRGIRVRKGADHFHRFLKAFDAFQGTSWSRIPDPGPETALELGNLLPRDESQALELINRFLRGSQALTRIDGSGASVPAPLRVAVLVDYAHFVAPAGDALQMGGPRSQVLIQLLDWASDPAITGAVVATVLVTDNLTDLNRALVDNPYSAKIKIDLPGADELRRYVADLTRDEADFDDLSDYDRDALGARLRGLSRVNVRSLLLRALRNQERITSDYLTRLRKELIEKEASGLIEFVESERTLDDVAGHVEAKAWFREDAALLRRGKTRALPMGYLLCGRIGTGKTYLVTCLAGEIGIPVVELKNFRERWVGATEGNLERIFTILDALGQVIVFVDEADQATGRRDAGVGDSGLSGRVYGMLAKEMSDTRNRGRIVWIFATSRPDLLEVDLKRQGRLDVHIPLFPPQDPESRRDLFLAMARKVGLDISQAELPPLPDDNQIGGNEMEGILVRAMRAHEAGSGPTLPEIIAGVIAEFRPSAHVERLELMDLLAVKECTDRRFLPPAFRDLGLGEVNRRIDELKLRLGER